MCLSDSTSGLPTRLASSVLHVAFQLLQRTPAQVLDDDRQALSASPVDHFSIAVFKAEQREERQPGHWVKEQGFEQHLRCASFRCGSVNPGCGLASKQVPLSAEQVPLSEEVPTQGWLAQENIGNEVGACIVNNTMILPIKVGQLIPSSLFFCLVNILREWDAWQPTTLIPKPL